MGWIMATRFSNFTTSVSVWNFLLEPHKCLWINGSTHVTKDQSFLFDENEIETFLLYLSKKTHHHHHFANIQQRTSTKKKWRMQKILEGKGATSLLSPSKNTPQCRHFMKHKRKPQQNLFNILQALNTNFKFITYAYVKRCSFKRFNPYSFVGRNFAEKIVVK